MTNERQQQGFESPVSMQQFRYTPPGQPRQRRQEMFVVQNRDPMREEEYPSVSTIESAMQNSTDERLLGADRTYVEAALESTGSQHNELRHHVDPSPVATPDQTETNNGSRVHGNRTRYQPPTVSDDAPDWRYDAEAYLNQSLGRHSASYNLPPSLQAGPVPPAPRPRQARSRLGDEAGRRRGRVFDNVTDYTTDPPTTVPFVPASHPSNYHSPQGRPTPATLQHSVYSSINNTNKNSNIPSLTPPRRTLPHPPSPSPVPKIPALILDHRNGQQLPSPPRNDHNPHPKIGSSHFQPVIGSTHPHPHPSPLTSHPPAPPAPRPPHPSQQPLQSPHSCPPEHSAQAALAGRKFDNWNRLHNLAAALILTDQEFPRALSRDGPGSRFPPHLIPTTPSPPAPQTASRHPGLEIPDIRIISPTTIGSSSSRNSGNRPRAPSRLVGGFNPGLPLAEGEMSVRSVARDGLNGRGCGESSSSSSSSLSSGWCSDEEFCIASSSPSSSPPSSFPTPCSRTASPHGTYLTSPLVAVNDDANADADADAVMREAAVLNLVDFHFAAGGDMVDDVLRAGAEVSDGERDGGKIVKSGREDEWSRLTVHTSEWVREPFPGEWARRFECGW
ncbi:MAG: hypothetical protein Q9201_006669 [Fulgogasparrea decipioides]